MPMAPPEFVLDTNVLYRRISAITPQTFIRLFGKLCWKVSKWTVVSIDKVREIYQIDDNLSEWVNRRRMFVSSEIQSVAIHLGND